MGWAELTGLMRGLRRWSCHGATAENRWRWAHRQGPERDRKSDSFINIQEAPKTNESGGDEERMGDGNKGVEGHVRRAWPAVTRNTSEGTKHNGGEQAPDARGQARAWGDGGCADPG